MSEEWQDNDEGQEWPWIRWVLSRVRWMGHELKQTHGGFSMNSTTITRNNNYQTKNGKIEIKVEKINPTYKWKWKAKTKDVESEMKHFEC